MAEIKSLLMSQRISSNPPFRYGPDRIVEPFIRFSTAAHPPGVLGKSCVYVNVSL